MKPLAHSGAKGLIVIAVACAAACGCGATSGSPSSDRESDGGTIAAEPLLGTWRYSGSVPDLVEITLTVRGDQTFTFHEYLAPATGPVGLTVNESCRTSESFLATYETVESETGSSLTWQFQQGVRDEISGCDDSARNRPGGPMTVDDLDYYISVGLVFPQATTYAVNANSLVVNPSVTGKVGLEGPTTFSRAQPADP